jgi:hypothetical protein
VPISPGTGIIEGFEPQMRAYLDAGGSADGLQAALSELSLVDGDGEIWHARAQVLVVDLTGNGTPEVVAGLTFLGEGGFADGGLFVFGCQDGRYEGGSVAALGGQVFPEGGPGPGIRAIQDLNANGVPDIVFSYIEMVGTHANFTRLFRVLEWNGTELVDLIESDTHPPDAAPVLNGDGAVLDTDGDRSMELVLTNGIGHGYEDGGPQRERTDVWAWNGHAFTLTRSEYQPPIYRFQAVQDGDDALRAGDHARALAFYNRAISDETLLGWSPGQLWPDSAYGTAPTPSPDPGERARLTAYATYRMMLVYVLQGALTEAQAAYETLAQMPEQAEGRQYADLAREFWEEYSVRGDLASACARAVAFAEAHAEDVLAPLGSAFYGYHNRDYGADDLCPFG